MVQNKLYVLCVGINEFAASGVSNLGGCENDAKNIYKYLEDSSENTEFELDGKMLLSKEATKANIVEAFQSHLGQAKKGDVAVFYFSGHGAEENADPVFHPFSHSENLTTMVCHDSRTNGVTDLADKELRYLIHKVSGEDKDTAPHLVIITDSCHSGGSTRSMEEVSDQLVARLTGEVSQRDWSDFIFANEIPREKVANAASLKDAMPEGIHVHLSSCMDIELAYEISGSGVFTSAMIDILKRSSGKVSYADINSRTRLLLGGKFPQRPTIYATDTETENSFFLGGASANKGVKGNIVYTIKNKWKLDLGAVHGITDDPQKPTQVKILNPEGDVIAHAEVDDTQASHSFLAIDPEALNAKIVDKRETYGALIENLYRPFISFHITGEDEGVKILEDWFIHDEEEQESLHRKNVKFVENEIDAQYVIRARKGQFLITKPFDDKPLVKQLFYRGKSTKTNLKGKYLHEIAIWEYLRNLHNGKTRLRPNPSMEIKVYKVHDENNRNKDELLVADSGAVEVMADEEVRIEVVNLNRRKKLYYSVFAMYSLFGIEIATDKMDYLNPERSVLLLEGDSIYMEGFEYIEDFNFQYNFMIFKCIYSTEPLDFNFNQDGMEEPVYPALDGNDMDRPIERRKRPDSEDWGTVDIMVKVMNPNYNPDKKTPEE